uniref:Secreted protein n=1 Tax=Ascaris lumbricoides TaxID=6252 RepID=A0A0M3HFK8_ASCLU
MNGLDARSVVRCVNIAIVLLHKRSGGCTSVVLFVVDQCRYGCIYLGQFISCKAVCAVRSEVLCTFLTVKINLLTAISFSELYQQKICTRQVG